MNNKQTKSFKPSGRLNSIFLWPVGLGILLVLLDILLCFVSSVAASIVAVFIVIYAFVCAMMICYFRPRIIKEIVEFSSNYSQVQRQLLYELSIPYCLLDNKGNILWMNASMQASINRKNDLNKNISTIIPELSANVFRNFEDFKEIRVAFNDRDYRVEMKRISADIITQGVNILAKDYNSSLVAMYMFDETVGQFWYNNLLSANNVGVPELGTYSGYSLLFGTHTATKDHAVAVLSDGAGYRMLYMNLSNGTQSVLADFAVPSNIINETTSYYPMKNEAYMLFTTNDKLYRYNLRELENNVAPGNSSVFVELSKWGYNAEAKITCMSVSRTEQEILLGVSRYGDDTEGMSEGLKGDVLVLDLKTGELVKKYEGISGVPVDVKIKYQKWLRDGKEGGNVVDMLYF